MRFLACFLLSAEIVLNSLRGSGEPTSGVNAQTTTSPLQSYNSTTFGSNSTYTSASAGVSVDAASVSAEANTQVGQQTLTTDATPTAITDDSTTQATTAETIDESTTLSTPKETTDESTTESTSTEITDESTAESTSTETTDESTTESTSTETTDESTTESTSTETTDESTTESTSTENTDDSTTQSTTTPTPQNTSLDPTTAFTANSTTQDTLTPLPAVSTSQSASTLFTENSTLQDTATPLPTYSTTQNTATPLYNYSTTQDTALISPVNSTSQNTTAPFTTNTTSQNTTAPFTTNTTSQNTTAPFTTNTTSQNTTAPFTTNTTSQNTTAPFTTNTTSQNTTAPFITNTTFQNTTAPFTTNTTTQYTTTSLPATTTSQNVTTLYTANSSTTNLPLDTTTHNTTTITPADETYQVSTTQVISNTTSQTAIAPLNSSTEYLSTPASTSVPQETTETVYESTQTPQTTPLATSTAAPPDIVNATTAALTTTTSTATSTTTEPSTAAPTTSPTTPRPISTTTTANVCSPNPCVNSGTCRPNNGSCVCLTGFTGKVCENNTLLADALSINLAGVSNHSSEIQGIMNAVQLSVTTAPADDKSVALSSTATILTVSTKVISVTMDEQEKKNVTTSIIDATSSIVRAMSQVTCTKNSADPMCNKTQTSRSYSDMEESMFNVGQVLVAGEATTSRNLSTNEIHLAVDKISDISQASNRHITTRNLVMKLPESLKDSVWKDSIISQIVMFNETFAKSLNGFTGFQPVTEMASLRITNSRGQILEMDSTDSVDLTFNLPEDTSSLRHNLSTDAIFSIPLMECCQHGTLTIEFSLDGAEEFTLLAGTDQFLRTHQLRATVTSKNGLNVFKTRHVNADVTLVGDRLKVSMYSVTRLGDVLFAKVTYTGQKGQQTAQSSFRRRLLQSGPTPFMTMTSLSPIYLNKMCQCWRSDNKMQITNVDAGNQVSFSSNFLGSFSVSRFLIPPNVINFNELFLNFSDKVESTPHVLALDCVLIFLTVLAVIFLRRVDRRDSHDWAYLPLLSNRKSDSWHYAVSVTTSPGSHIRLDAVPCFSLIGQYGQTRALALQDGIRDNFKKGSTNNFIMSTSSHLGPVFELKLWLNMTHLDIIDKINEEELKKQGDFSWWSRVSKKFGSSTRGRPEKPRCDWKVDHIAVMDLSTGERYTFMIRDWLSETRGDESTYRHVPVLDPSEAEGATLFGLISRKKLFDEHLWLSVARRPTYSIFTRVQRFMCAVSILFLTMVTNAMWYQTESTTEESVDAGIELGSIRITFRMVQVGVFSSLIVMCPAVVMTYIFKRRRLGPTKSIKVAPDMSTLDSGIDVCDKYSTMSEFQKGFVTQKFGSDLKLFLPARINKTDDVYQVCDNIVPMYKKDCSYVLEESFYRKQSVEKCGYDVECPGSVVTKSRLFEHKDSDEDHSALTYQVNENMHLLDTDVRSILEETFYNANNGSDLKSDMSHFDIADLVKIPDGIDDFNVVVINTLTHQKTTDTNSIVTHEHTSDTISNVTHEQTSDKHSNVTYAHSSGVHSYVDDDIFQVSETKNPNESQGCKCFNSMSEFSENSYVPDVDSVIVEDSHLPKPYHYCPSPYRYAKTYSDAAGKYEVHRHEEYVEGKRHGAGIRGMMSERRFLLPWWALFVGYTVVVLSIAVSASITFFYSLEWGGEITLKWMASLFFAATSGTFLLEPIKILILTLALSCVFRDHAHEELSDMAPVNQVYSRYPQTIPHESLDGSVPLPHIEPRLPDAFSADVSKQRTILKLQQRLSEITRTFSYHVVYIVLFCVICLSTSVPTSYRQNKVLRNGLNWTGQGEPRNVKEILQWMSVKAVPYILPKKWSNGALMTVYQQKFTSDLEMYRLTPMSLTQWRVRDECLIRKKIKDILNGTMVCSPDYKEEWKETGSFVEGWVQCKARCDRPAYVYTLGDQWALNQYGELAVYSPGGYMVIMPQERSDALSAVNILASQNWLDHLTRAVLLEQAVYNPNTRLFTQVKVLFELPSSGGVFSKLEVRSANLYPYTTAWDYLLLLAQIGFAVSILVRTCVTAHLLVCSVIKAHNRPRLTPDVAVEGVELAFSVTAVACYATRAVQTISLVEYINNNPRISVSMDAIFAYDELYTVFISSVFFMRILRLLGPMSINSQLYILRYTLIASTPVLLSIWLSMVILLVAFASFFYIYEGPVHDDVKSVYTIVSQLLNLLLAMAKSLNIDPDSKDVLKVRTYKIMSGIFTSLTTIFFFNFAISLLNLTLTNLKSEELHCQTHLEDAPAVHTTTRGHRDDIDRRLGAYVWDKIGAFFKARQDGHFEKTVEVDKPFEQTETKVPETSVIL